MVTKLQQALKLINKGDETDKKDGIQLFREILESERQQAENLGHDLVIFKELVTLVELDHGDIETLSMALQLLESEYFKENRYWDQLAELLIVRVGRSNKNDSSKLLLEKLLSLVEHFDDSVAKHSKCILQLIDYNEDVDLNETYIKILESLKEKLPKRKI